MRTTLNNIFITILLLATASCSNDFLNNDLEIPTVPAGESTIYISPEWESADYQFYLPEMGNADFKIEAMPSWLQINSTTGKLVNSIANIHCSATKVSDFDKIGIYIDKIKVSVGKQTFYVPVVYITEGNPKIEVEETITFNIGDYYMSLEIKNTGEGLLMWDVVSLPGWLEIDKERLNSINPLSPIIAQNSYYNVPFTINPENFTGEETELKGNIILKTNDKDNPIVEIEAKIELGSPEISLWLYNNNTIDFGGTSTNYSLDIDAWGSGLLVWHFEDVPEWLTITPSKGVYRTHTSYSDVTFTCDRSKLQPGVNSSIIYLKSNAYNKPSIAITVKARAPGNNANIRQLEGNIVDVAFDNNTNTLYYVAEMPNKFVAYNVVNRTVLYDLNLSKTPTCLAVSEDNKKAVVGHGGKISVVNLENQSITESDINGTLYDITWSNDDWFCYSIQYNSLIQWINVSNSATYKTSNASMYTHFKMEKIPNHPYIVATETSVSPSGFYILSTSTKEQKNYAHMSLNKFWISQDGQYIFCWDGYIYRSSDVTGYHNRYDDFNSIGHLRGTESNDYHYSYTWLEHSSTARSIWTIDNEQSAIRQYEDNDFTYQKSYFYSDIYQPNAQSTYEVSAQYIFSNNEGTELSVLCKGKNNNNWSVEFIQVAP